jgi:hypothetical protein
MHTSLPLLLVEDYLVQCVVLDLIHFQISHVGDDFADWRYDAHGSPLVALGHLIGDYAHGLVDLEATLPSSTATGPL